jgi:hypothetical protein
MTYLVYNHPPIQRRITEAVPIPVADKVWSCDRSLAGIVGLNPAGGMDACLVWVLCVVW